MPEAYIRALQFNDQTSINYAEERLRELNYLMYEDRYLFFSDLPFLRQMPSITNNSSIEDIII